MPKRNRPKRFHPISHPIRLHLEFEELTGGQLAYYLNAWQALLNRAWQEYYAREFRQPAPRSHVIVTTGTSDKSVELCTLLAIPVGLAQSFVAQNLNWQIVANGALHFLRSRWLGAPSDQPPPLDGLSSELEDRINALCSYAYKSNVTININIDELNIHMTDDDRRNPPRLGTGNSIDG